jgi:hypothetical protein
MRRTLTALAALAAVALVGCGTTPSDGTDPAAPGGFGMRYDGKLGMDLGGGLVMPLDGSGIGPGFGF